VHTEAPPRSRARIPPALVQTPRRFPWQWLLLLPLGALLWVAGRAVGLGGIQQFVAVGVATGILVTVFGGVILWRRVGWGALALEVPVLLLLLSTLVFRQRTATDLAGQPLDLAAQIRVAEVAIAGILGFFALLWGQMAGGRVTTLPFRLYGLYVLVVFAGAPGSVDPPLTAYRGLELAVALIVLAGARRSLGDRAGPRIEATLYWFCVGLLITVWVNAIIFPDEAVVELANLAAPWRLQLQSVYPSIAPNTLGLIGVIVAAWSPARVRSPEGTWGLSKPVAYLLVAFGTISLLAAQYRTGYVAIAAVVAVYVLMRGKKVLGTLLVGAAIAIAIWAPYATKQAEPFLLRGQSVEQAGELSSRTVYWSRAIPVWQTSPIIGRGLLTASRFEVLAPLGLEYTAGIHGTWPEALVGAGILGTGLLAIIFLIIVARAITQARRGWIAPLLLLTVITVRSVTGPTFESFSFTAVIFLWLALFSDELPELSGPEEEPRGGRSA
jgi:O-antigen ligase